MEIKFACTGQEICRDPADLQEVVAGSRDMLTARITYDSLWDGLQRIVLWSNGSTCVGTVDLTGEVVVPWEALQPGELYVSVLAIGPDGSKRLVTKAMERPVLVLPCGATEETGPARAPTPTVVEQLTAMVAAALDKLAGIDAALDAADTAARRAELAVERAELLLQPPQPDTVQPEPAPADPPAESLDNLPVTSEDAPAPDATADEEMPTVQSAGKESL